MKQIILLLYFSCLISIVSCRKHFWDHVEDQVIQGSDRVSSPTKRICRLYSKKSANHIRIKGKRVDAKGKEDDNYTKMEISSVQFKGRVAIRGVESNRYLCMNKKGRLVAKVRRSRRRNCVFIEKITEDNHLTFRNVRHPKWYIGFQANGKPKRGNKVKWEKPEVRFLKRKMEKPPSHFQSSLRPAKWDEITEKLRCQVNKGKQPNIAGPVCQPMMGDDPGVLVGLNPPDIQEELDKKKKAMIWKQSRDNNSNQPLSITNAMSLKRERGRRRRPKDRRRKEDVTDTTKADMSKKNTRRRKSSPQARAHSPISRGSPHTSGSSAATKQLKRKIQAAHKRRGNRLTTAVARKSRDRDSTSRNDVT